MSGNILKLFLIWNSSNNVYQSWVVNYKNTLFVDFKGTVLTRACLCAIVLGWR